jgi:hypothetical protein
MAGIVIVPGMNNKHLYDSLMAAIATDICSATFSNNIELHRRNTILIDSIDNPDYAVEDCTKPNSNSFPLHGKDPNKVFGGRKKRKSK